MCRVAAAQPRTTRISCIYFFTSTFAAARLVFFRNLLVRRGKVSEALGVCCMDEWSDGGWRWDGDCKLLPSFGFSQYFSCFFFHAGGSVGWSWVKEWRILERILNFHFVKNFPNIFLASHIFRLFYFSTFVLAFHFRLWKPANYDGDNLAP